MRRLSALLTGMALPLILAGAACTIDAHGVYEAGEATMPDVPWTLEDPVPDDDGETRVLVLHDMEGLSGQSDPRTFSFRQTEYYPMGREYLIADVNAVIAGLFDGGADVVHVVDGHGSGNPDSDIDRDRLDPRARMVERDAPFESYVDIVEAGAYDAVAVVGMHAKTGSGGFASHTYTLGIGVVLNGASVTETEIVALSWGRHGVPVIFASGDDRLAADLETMPWIEYVTVKTATSASTAEPRPVDEARADLREGARVAIESRDSARSMRPTLPVTATLTAVPPADLSAMDGVPGVDYADGAVTFVARDFREAYDGLRALVNVAGAGRTAVMAEVLQSLDPNGIDLYVSRLFERWLDVESGRWTPPEMPQAPARTYYGYR